MFNETDRDSVTQTDKQTERVRETDRDRQIYSYLIFTVRRLLDTERHRETDRYLVFYYQSGKIKNKGTQDNRHRL